MGGIGKTRLALEVARQQANIFLDGVYFVPLAGLSSVRRVVPAIADALGVSFSGQKESRVQSIKTQAYPFCPGLTGVGP